MVVLAWQMHVRRIYVQEVHKMSCGKADNNGKAVSGSALLCGTKLTYGVNKEPRRTVVHLCRDCEAKEQHENHQ